MVSFLYYSFQVMFKWFILKALGFMRLFCLTYLIASRPILCLFYFLFNRPTEMVRKKSQNSNPIIIMHANAI